MQYNKEETEKYLDKVRNYLKETYGQIKPVWENLISLLGDQYDSYLCAKDAVAQYGMLIQSSRGMVSNPAIKIQNDAIIQINKIWAELGITPKMEIKLKTGDKKESLDDDGFLATVIG